MDNPELIEKYDVQLRQLALDMRHDGIRHEVIKDLFSRLTEDLEIIAHAENDLNTTAEIP